ncbi:alpha/beta fold hydrolase [Shewanella intestini]|uniref:Alpha/beta fold hydrolase n=1 Tax=Shewanella intestini TaxID=2017544 RepID=A0ABS5I0Q5_9GAMM|nr:alpha/beta fold hydrolase [Shewanella intestini]MRG35241.1 alpha/beta fold hydrolase [Shewanella sp. XMDDZSB0408]
MKRTLLMVIATIVLLPILYLIYFFVILAPMSDAKFKQQLPAIVQQLESKIEGNGDETIVMIHGYPDTLAMWDAQADYLKQHYTVARFTLPGYGQNDNGKRPHYNIKQIRMITDAFIKSLHKDKVTVFAHDWGAIYAFHYLEKNSLVDKLVLFDVGSFGDEPRPKVNMQYTLALAIAWTLPEFLGEKLTLYTAENILNLADVDASKTINDLRSEPRLTYPYYHLWHSVLTKNLNPSLSIDDYQTPFLFMYGNDKKVWFHADSWKNQIIEKNKAEVIAIKGGHWFMQSSADDVNQQLSQWLNKEKHASEQPMTASQALLN